MNLKRSKYILVASIMTGSLGINLKAEISDSNQCSYEVEKCKSGTTEWKDNGEVIKTTTGERGVEGKYIIDYKQEQVNEAGVSRIIRTDHLVEIYDTNGRLTQKEDWNYNQDGHYIGCVVTNYRQHKQTNEYILSRIREYDTNGVVSDDSVATTWESKGIKKNTSGKKNQKNSTYTEDFIETRVSNFGDIKTRRTDYKVEKYNSSGKLSIVEDWDYDEQGKETQRTVKDYRFNAISNQNILARTRVYAKGKLLTDKKTPTTWKNEGIKVTSTGKKGVRNSTYIEDFKETKVSNFGEKQVRRTEYRIHNYNSKGHMSSREVILYNSKGEYMSKTYYNYVQNPITNKKVTSRTRIYKGSKLISDKKVATTWKNSGSKKKTTTGKKSKANSTYIEDYKQPQTSNFGQKRTIRVDYKVWKYNKYKQVIQDENWNYDKNGVYTTKTVKNYYYNSITKKSINTRIRTYNKKKLTSDLRKNQLRKPTRKGTITNEFNGKDLTYSGGHKGIDIAAPTGTPIYPVISGRIIEISYDRVGGNKVVLHHKINGIDYVTYYGHMSKLTRNYKVGDIVDVNNKIGSMGSSGLSTGSHVHFELMVGTSKKNHRKAVNPRTYIDFPKLWKSY